MLFSRVFVVAISAPDGSDCFFRLGLLVILIRSSFCGAFSFVEPLVCCLLLDSESPSGSKARELRRSWPLSFIWFRQSRMQNIQKRIISGGQNSEHMAIQIGIVALSVLHYKRLQRDGTVLLLPITNLEKQLRSLLCALQIRQDKKFKNLMP